MAHKDDLNDLLKKYAWNSLQIQQLRLADKHHVTLKYFSPQYDWEQLREIRLALEDGLDPSFLLDKHINSDSMKRSREKVYESSGLYSEKTKQKKQKRMITLVMFLIMITSIVLVGLWKKDFIYSMIYDLKLELKTDKKIIGLSELNNFHYIDLIQDYTKDCELIIPQEKISDIGEYNLKYTVRNESKELSKNVVLIVRDDIKPVIKLKHHTINIDYDKAIDLHSNIVSCTDNVDGDIKSKITIEDSVNTKKEGKYTVVYEVSDLSGNKATEKVNVIVKKKDNVNSIPNTRPSQSSSNSSSSINNNSSQNHSSSNVPVKAKDKIFLFEQYGGDSATTQNQAVNYGNKVLNGGKANRFDCVPVYKNGLCIGYEVKFS